MPAALGIVCKAACVKLDVNRKDPSGLHLQNNKRSAGAQFVTEMLMWLGTKRA